MKHTKRLTWTSGLYLPAPGGGRWIAHGEAGPFAYALRRIGGAYEVWTDGHTGWSCIGSEGTATTAYAVASAHWQARVALAQARED